MGGVPHTDEGLNDDIYAVPVKRRQPKDQKTVNESNDKISDDRESEDKDENLPTGWEKHEGIFWKN